MNDWDDGSMAALSSDSSPVLPSGWLSRPPTVDDVGPLTELGNAHLAATRGSGSVDEESVLAAAVGAGAWTRRQVVAVDPSGRPRAWASVHDRAAGRADVRLVTDPTCAERDLVAAPLLAWLEAAGVELARARAVEQTRFDVVVEEGDTELQGWLEQAGFARVRR